MRKNKRIHITMPEKETTEQNDKGHSKQTHLQLAAFQLCKQIDH